jgi:hypothetical protein
MANPKISSYVLKSWPVNSDDENSLNIGLGEPGRGKTAHGLFHLVEKKGKLEAVVNLDQLNDLGIPVYLGLGARKILVQS